MYIRIRRILPAIGGPTNVGIPINIVTSPYDDVSFSLPTSSNDMIDSRAISTPLNQQDQKQVYCKFYSAVNIP